MSPIALSRFLLVVSLVTLAPAPWSAAPAKRTERQQSRVVALETVIRAELKATRTPGAAVAVIAGGRVVYMRGFGAASVETKAPVTASTLFRLGSTTKMMTGAGLVVLAEKGKIRLDAPIGDVASGLSPKLARLTAHQLLSNSAGVADFAAPVVSHDDGALASMIRGWKDDVLFGEPGRVYSYSSPGFWLAGYVLEQAGGKPYADVMDEWVFAPAGMTRTTLRPLVAMTHPLAVGHQLQGEVIVLTNRSGETLPRTTEKAQELFLPLTPAKAPVREALPLAPGDARRFVGVYVNAEQTWEVALREGRLVLREGDSEIALTKTGPWRLSYGEGLAGDVGFVAGVDGRAEYVFTGLYAGRRRVEPAQQAPRR